MEQDNQIFKPKEKKKGLSKRKLFFHDDKVAEANQFETKEERKKQGFWSRFQLPKRWVDVTHPFYFNVYKFRTDGLIFLTLTFFLPFVMMVLMYLGARPITGLVTSITTLVTTLIGFFLFLKRDRALFISSGLIFYFITRFGLFGIGLIASFISASLLTPEQQSFFFISLDIVQSLIWVVLIFTYSKDLSERFTITIKKNWKMLLLVGAIAALLLWATSGPLWNLIAAGTVLDGPSANQDALGGSGIIMAILVFIYTILIAPLYEELLYRNMFYVGSGNRIAGFFLSAIVFAMMHVQTGDLEHIFPYLIGGFGLSAVFNIGRGNVTYSWMAHVLYNLISVILMFTLNWQW